MINFYFLRYLTKCALKLFVTGAFLPSHFSSWPKTQNKDLNISRTKRPFKMKQKSIFIIFKGGPVAINCLKPESASLKQDMAEKVNCKNAEVYFSFRFLTNSCCKKFLSKNREYFQPLTNYIELHVLQSDALMKYDISNNVFLNIIFWIL